MFILNIKYSVLKKLNQLITKSFCYLQFKKYKDIINAEILFWVLLNDIPNHKNGCT